MSGFSAGWLDLREPADAAARAADLCDGLAGWAAPRAPLAVVDLGSGTGASLRALAPRLGHGQRWALLEHDPDLLTALPARVRAWAAGQGASCRTGADGLRLAHDDWSAELRPRRVDLAAPDGLDDLAGADLVTASALLDLVSRAWLDRLVAALGRAAGYFALTVDGRVEPTPPHADDHRVLDLFAAHQRRDKGLGAALGPEAGAALAALLDAGGRHRVATAASDWVLEPAAADLQADLIDGYAAAASAQAPAEAQRIAAWRKARLALVARGEGHLRVGYGDLLALPLDNA